MTRADHTMNHNHNMQHTAESGSTLSAGEASTSAQAPRHAATSGPFVDTEATIEAVLKRHYGTAFTEQDVRFARDLRDELRASLAIAGGQTLSGAARVSLSYAEIEQKWNDANEACAQPGAKGKHVWKHFAESLLNERERAPSNDTLVQGCDASAAATMPPAVPHTEWTYCTPRDNDTPKYLIVFDDAERPPVLLTDDGAARTAFDRHEQNWNCHLFELAKRSPTAVAQGEATRAAFTWPRL
jgi:hypothetical protein